MAVEAGAHALAGALGGSAAMAVLYPLDALRCRLQVEHKAPVISSASSGQENERSGVSDSAHKTHSYQRLPKGMVGALLHILKHEGYGGLYRGLKSSIIGVAVSSFIYFFWYSRFKNAWLRYTQTRNLSPNANVLVAAIAGAVNCLFTIPLWVVNTRIVLSRTSGERFNGVYDALTKLYGEGGVAALYPDLVPSLALVSNPMIQFAVYEQLATAISKYRYQRWKNRMLNSTKWSWADMAVDTTAATKALGNIVSATEATATSELVAAESAAAASTVSKTPSIPLRAWQYFLLGAFSKAVATVITYPLQVVKARLQERDSPYSGPIDCVKTMMMEEGISAFFQGMQPKLFQTVLNSAFMFASYEQIVRFNLLLLRWIFLPRNANTLTASK